MKLLLDQNLSPKLIKRINDRFPGSEHVYNINLSTATDLEVWEYAKDHRFMIVSKDADFSELSLINGFPPKIIWIKRGNCSTSTIESILYSHFDDIAFFSKDSNNGILILY